MSCLAGVFSVEELWYIYIHVYTAIIHTIKYDTRLARFETCVLESSMHYEFRSHKFVVVAHFYRLHRLYVARLATETNESCHTHERAMSHVRLNHVAQRCRTIIVPTHMSKSCHTYVSYVTHMHESRATYA